MKLAIISHTPHYVKENHVVGWGSTVREINYLSKIFDEIYHIAPLHKGTSPGSSLRYTSDKINFIALKPYGGEKFTDKISVFTTAIYNLRKIRSILNKVDWVQFRAPTAMGLYVLPYISMRRKPRRWVKYAGNWKMYNPPLSYSIQKWWLENNLQKSKVTINGQWEGQKQHVLNFQNPCMDNDEYRRAEAIGLKKNYEGRLTICFAGTLTKNKGVDMILEALTKITSGEMISEVIFAGDGSERKKYEDIADGIKVKTVFMGFLDRKNIEDVYERSHIIVLPSESEGFPKVIAEAAAFGCVPIVSDVSSISSYFNDMNGFLLKKINSDEIAGKIDLALSDRVSLKEKSLLCIRVAGLFTFEKYIKDLKEKILVEPD